VILDYDEIITNIWKEEKQASVEAIHVARYEALRYLAMERERIMKLSKEDAIREVLKASKIANDNIIVYSFEPVFSTFNSLIQNIILNKCQNNIFPFLIPLSSNAKLSKMYLNSTVSGSSLHTVDTNIDYKGDYFSPEYVQNIISHSIDNLIFDFGFKRPNLIKIDVDGCELEILLGSKKTLKCPELRSIIVEICILKSKEKTFIDFFNNYGFVCTEKIAHGSQETATIFDLVFNKVNYE